MPSTPPVITRFAPSPTGHLHIGGARTALFCWAFAKRMGGHFLLRIEDTDAARSSDESARGIMQDLAWLGIEWDEGPLHALNQPAAPARESSQASSRTLGGDPRHVGPFFQAQRLNIYHDHIMRLVEQGRAYPAFETEDELAAEKQRAKDAKANYRYNRASYEKVKDIKDRLRLIEAGEPHIIRFLSLPEEIAFTDQVLGDVKIAPGEIDDFIIRRRDGFPMYNFAVVVDDHAMGITHVLRAQEHLSNTPRQIALYRAFGYTPPQFGHMPLIFNMDGTKMGKRDKAKAARKTLKDFLCNQGGPGVLPQSLADQLGVNANELAAFLAAENDSLDIAAAIARHFKIPLPEIQVSDFREAGYTPEAICNFLSLLGWNPGMKTPDGKDLEKFDKAFLAQHFSIERIGRTNAKFDRTKLLSFNADSIAAMPDDQFVARWQAWCRENEPDFARALSDHAPPTPNAHVRWHWLARAIKPRAKTFRDAVRACTFLTLNPHYPFDPAAVAKALTANSNAGLNILRDIRARLAAIDHFDPTTIHQILEQAAQHYGGMGSVAQPIRVAITGTTVSPPLGETLAVLGKDATLVRIDRCLHQFMT
jgi:glutamyl-tRNA synthetase